MIAHPGLPLRLAAVPGFVLLIAVCAGLSVPMFPVPMTMQTWAVLLAGVVLGWRWGGGAVLSYLVLGLTGLPVFSDGASGVAPFTGPTAGYLLAFPLAAAAAGVLAEQGRLRGFIPASAWLFGLHLSILAVGTGWLAIRMGVPVAVAAGFTPFLIGAAVKSGLVVLAARALSAAPGFRPA
ncbi:biotin transporter BioY [Brevundimonas sp. UBA2416]|uniref:biotin transporter BioY n=1 Tax=Brevundimonas sp. UBA2416 TaxID=1946124 RepID=UPI0025C32247|nr:biotin transporter BioY [Brevundimonas sp. UBA2416]HRJ63358.1 biotin transporter BioY [Brevundimonas sp.]